MSYPFLDDTALGTYRFITFIVLCLTHFFSVVLLIIKTPKTESLRGYRISKYILAVAYAMVTVFNAVELLMDDVFSDERYVLLNTLTASSLQLFLVSATLIILINPGYFNFRIFLRELLLPCVLSIVAFILLDREETTAFNLVLLAFQLYFGLQCVRYLLEFNKEKKETLRKLDNYFSSETNIRKIQWITQTFIALIFMGIMALLSCILPKYFLIPFTALYFVFYFFLGMKHINFVFYFNEYELIFNHSSGSSAPVKPNMHPLYWEQLEKAVTEWEKNGYYREPGLTIEQVAMQLNTNRTYVSNFINQVKMQSFKEWINLLRIEESKRLLLDKPELRVSEIGVMVGLPDKSNFGRLFTRNTGSSPQLWRKKQLKR